MKTLAYRVAFFVCGVISVLMGLIYNGYRHLDTEDRPAGWIVLSIAFVAVGIVSVAVAMPLKSLAKILFGERLDHGAWLLLPFKMLAVFFIAAYLVAAVLALISPTVWLSLLWVYAFCPSCVFTYTGLSYTPLDWLELCMLIVAPTSAAVYGSIGGAIGVLIRTIQK